jgi:hypothetical protein
MLIKLFCLFFGISTAYGVGLAWLIIQMSSHLTEKGECAMLTMFTLALSGYVGILLVSQLVGLFVKPS